jgi:hypothetical protein
MIKNVGKRSLAYFKALSNWSGKVEETWWSQWIFEPRIELGNSSIRSSSAQRRYAHARTSTFSCLGHPVGCSQLNSCCLWADYYTGLLAATWYQINHLSLTYMFIIPDYLYASHVPVIIRQWLRNCGSKVLCHALSCVTNLKHVEGAKLRCNV